MLGKSIFWMATVLALGACSSPPPKLSPLPTRSTVAAGEYDKVWDNVVDFFASRNIAIKTIAKDSGIVAAERAGFDNSVAICDERLLRDFRKIASFNVRVQRGGSEQRVTVNSEYRLVGIEIITGTATARNCQPTGLLENQILTAARKK
jgi:hypothetical protein